MIGIGTWLGDHANVRAAIPTVSGIVEGGLYFKLLKAVRIGNRNTATPRSATLYIAHTYPVEFPIVVIRACP